MLDEVPEVCLVRTGSRKRGGKGGGGGLGSEADTIRRVNANSSALVQAELAAAEKTAADLAAEASKSKAEVEQLTKELRDAVARQTDLAAEGDGAKADNDRLRQELKEAQDALQEAHASASALAQVGYDSALLSCIPQRSHAKARA